MRFIVRRLSITMFSVGIFVLVASSASSQPAPAGVPPSTAGIKTVTPADHAADHGIATQAIIDRATRGPAEVSLPRTAAK